MLAEPATEPYVKVTNIDHAVSTSLHFHSMDGFLNSAKTDLSGASTSIRQALCNAWLQYEHKAAVNILSQNTTRSPYERNWSA